MARLLFGQFYWVWIVGFFSTASLLSWISVSQILKLYEKKTYKAARIKNNAIASGKKLSTRIILTGRNIFDPNGGMVEDKKKPKIKKVEKREEPKVKSTVPGCPPILPGVKIPESKVRTVRLKGTSYVELDPSQSVAAVYVKVKNKTAPPPPRPIKAKSTKRGKKSKLRRRRTRRIRPRRRYYRRSRGKWRWTTEIFRVGELMMEKMRICMIGPKEIIFFHQNKLQKFSLEKKKKKKLRYYGSLGIAKPKDNSDGPGQVRIDAIDKRTISRKTVQDWLQNPMAHATSARIMPVRTGGLRLVWVRKKSLYSQLGLKTGDTVLSVNGKKLNVANALGLYSQLPYAKMLKVNVVRRGVRRQLQFKVK